MDYSEFRDPYESRELCHSGPGIASFIVGVAAGLFEFLLIGGVALAFANAQEDLDERSPAAILVGLALFGGVMMALLGVALGIAGLCQSYRNKLFAVLGLVVNLLVVLGLGLLMVIGAFSD